MQERTTEKYSVNTIPYLSQTRKDDETSLIDLWLFIHKHRLWLLVGVLSGVLLAIAYIGLAAPIYESHASIQIGKVHDKGLIEELNTLAVQLMDQYGPESEVGRQGKRHYLKRVLQASNLKQSGAASDVLKLVAEASSAEEARDFLASIVTKLMQRHEQIYVGTLDPLLRRLAAIDREIEPMMAQTKELGSLVSRLKESQPAQASLVGMERARLYVELSNLGRERMLLQRQIAIPHSSPSKIVAPAALRTEPVAPRSSISLLVGIMLGLTIGLFAAFFREFYATWDRGARSNNND